MKNSESRVFCKGENSKKIYCDQKKLVPRQPVWKIQSPECSVNENIPKIFYLKCSMTRKSSFPHPFTLTIQSPECSVNENIPKKFLPQI